MLAVITVIGNREHDQDVASVIKVYIEEVQYLSKSALELFKGHHHGNAHLKSMDA